MNRKYKIDCNGQSFVNKGSGGHMNLYHGSYVEVDKPHFVNVDYLDYGSGFYITSSYELASNMAIVACKRRKMGKPIVSVYEFDERALNLLNVKVFDGPNGEWLEYVVQNRKGIYRGLRYDLVIGPVANDNTLRVISDYMAGSIDKETALVLLKPQKLKDQYAFLTKDALAYIKIKEVKCNE